MMTTPHRVIPETCHSLFSQGNSFILHVFENLKKGMRDPRPCRYPKRRDCGTAEDPGSILFPASLKLRRVWEHSSAEARRAQADRPALSRMTKTKSSGMTHSFFRVLKDAGDNAKRKRPQTIRSFGTMFLFLAVAAFCTALPLLSLQAAAKESTFDRVMRTNTLRCGYVVLPPQFIIDPKTNQMSGIAYDIVTEAAKRLHLKVEWTEQVNFATVGEGMKAGRYDAFCLTTYRWANLARAFDYTDPIFYTTTDAYARGDDHRFDNNLAAIDKDKIRIAVIDGEGGEVIRNENFAKAQMLTLPQDTALSLMLENVATGKADVTFTNPLVAMPYMLAKPGAVHRVPSKNPIRAYAHALAFGKGDQDMVSTFNVVLDEMRNGGVIDQILDKYEKIPNSFVRVESPVWRH